MPKGTVKEHVPDINYSKTDRGVKKKPSRACEAIDAYGYGGKKLGSKGSDSKKNSY